MLKTIARGAWKFLPGFVRSKIVRITQAKFTVSAAAVILNPNNEVLLLNHVLRPNSGWGLPGGFLDSGEQPDEAIRREIREETGIEMDSLRMLRVRVAGLHVEMLFSAKSDGDATVQSREIIGLGWFTLENTPQGLSAGQKKIIENVFSGL